MIRLIWAQLRLRRGRSVATLAAVAIAVASFALLFSAARQSRLELTATVTDAARPAYDLMVRPADAVTPVEQAQGLVQSGQLAGMSGGITEAQWRRIAALPDVDVAAPIGVGGYVIQYGRVKIDLTPYVKSGVDQQVLRVSPTFVADGGTSRLPDGDIYLYVTKNHIDWDGSRLHERIGGRSVDVCGNSGGYSDTNLLPSQRRVLVCWSTDPTSASILEDGMSGGHPYVYVQFGFPMLVVGVDPAQEARLDGLDTAVTAGRYLTAADGPSTRTISQVPAGSRMPPGSYTTATIPMLLAGRTQVDERVELSVSRVDGVPAVTTVSDSTAAMNVLDERPGQVVGHETVGADTAYADVVRAVTKVHDRPDDYYAEVNNLVVTGPVAVDPALRAQAVPPSAQLIAGPFDYWGWQNPIDLGDTMVRPFTDRSPDGASYEQVEDGTWVKQLPDLQAVGQFDPDRIVTGPQLTQAPMDLAYVPGATAADDAARAALGDRKLLPSTNLGGLIAHRPSVVTTLAGMQALLRDPFRQVTNADKPISMVRVRLTGDVGLDDLSTERLRAVGDRIHALTGLRVDVVVGASPSNVDISLPAGKYGRPAMVVAEPWSKKGVAANVVTAVDRKTVLFALLVLIACGLAVGNATSAAVRTRRTELGVLSCLGWPARRLFGLVLGEAAAVGLAAGVLGTGAAFGLAPPLGVPIQHRVALLAVPAAVGLALLAGLGPAVRATRATPAAALRPAVTARRHGVALRGVFGLAVRNVARTPGRSVLGALSLTVGMTAVVLLAVIDVAFQGGITGSLLGNAVTVQAAPADYLAAAITALLGAVSVADVLYVNVRERSAEYALLRATGWADRPLARLVAYEAALIASAGAVAGGVLALGLTALLAPQLTRDAYAVAAACAAGGVVLALLASAVPMRMIRSIPAARLLAED
ncbi:ABC transporter permease [Hamadaea tsunoensis]|uniref:ABC transporter permease n=1 Tax=Hamadaea tsunoensis TaxID=53368 RepID=UPI00040377D5|nr:ABC transporter permease [Hamadaea tsunoensis]